MEYTQNLKLGPTVLGILLTSKCNVSCRHCCNCSGPDSERVLDFSTITRMIDDASRLDTLKEVGVSGGEPFLFLNLLKKTLRYASDRGFTTSVTTNGFWGKSKRANSLLSELKAEGLTAVCISTSRFHQEFIALSTMIQAAQVALRVGLRTTINVVASSALPVEAIRDELGSVADEVDIVAMPCLPTGRAGEDVARQELPTSTRRPLGNCHRHFEKLAVDLNGDVWPCCSPGGFTEPLKLGNASRQPIDEIVAQSGNSTLLTILDDVGPAFFLPFLREAGLDDVIPDQFSDQCHLCHSMLSSPKAAKVVDAACQRLANEIRQIPKADRPMGRFAQSAI